MKYKFISKTRIKNYLCAFVLFFGHSSANAQLIDLDAIEPGTWAEIPNSDLYSVRPIPTPPGNSGFAGIMNAWNGGAYDTHRERLLIWGGGHADYSGNEIYAFDINSQQWVMVEPPTPNDQIISNAGSVEIYADGKPSSRHTYDGLVYLPPPYDALWEQGGSRWIAGGGTGATWMYSFSESQWSRKANVPSSLLGVISAYDPVTGNIIHRGRYSLHSYNPANDTYTILKSNSGGWWWDLSAAIAPTRRYFVIVGRGETQVFDLQTNTFFTPPISGATAIQELDAPGLVYDPVADKMVAWPGGGPDIYTLDLDTWVWTKEIITGNVAPPAQAANSYGTYGRFQYIASENIFIGVNHVNENVYMFRLTTNTPLATTATPESSEVELYNTFTLNLNRSDITSNKFSEFPQVTFSKGAKSLLVEGFYYGDDSGTADGDNWKVRFMPDETGIWSYSWNFNGDTGTGTFNVTAQSNNLVRGHIKRAGRFLVADDGKGFLYRGSNWPDTRRYRVNENDAPQILLSSTDWVNYVTRLSDTNHNGTYMSVMDRLVNDDRLSFDLAWIEKIDFALEEAGARGIYVFLGIFNTWTRSSTDPFVTVTNSSDQILDPWNNNLMAEKEFYIRYLAARFAGYYNTLWELGNEVGHSNSGNDFRDLANGFYIPWLRQYDPYDIPITLSENEFQQIDVEIGGFHQAQTIGLNETMPIIHTELVSVSGATGVLWKGISCRNTANRRYYRRTSWKGFIEGGSGSIECSLPFSGENPFLSMDDFLAHPDIRNVMDDHGRLGAAIDSFNNDITDLIPAPTGELGTSSVTFKLRTKADEEYVAYFWGGVGSGASISLNIPAGEYLAKWNSPATGLISSVQTVNNGDTIISPWSGEYDVMLRVYQDSGNLTSTTLNASSNLVNSGDTITLSWSSDNTNSCVASGGWSGSRSVSGSEISPALTTETTFTLDCIGDSGSSSDSVTVNIDTGGVISLGSGIIITNALVYDENNGADWSIQNNLQPGDVMYGDRSYRYTQISANLIGQEWLSTANNSRSFVGENLVAFTVSEDAEVFILHRDGITNKPEWLSGWADTNTDVTNGEPQTYSIFSRSFSAGSLVSLGANGSTTSGMYLVVVAPANSNNDLIFSDNFE